MLAHRFLSFEDRPETLSGIHNYYEQRVIDALFSGRYNLEEHDMEFAADVVCVALNHLPPRYVRHAVDMAFYLSPAERDEMEAKIHQAIETALAYVGEREKRGE